MFKQTAVVMLALGSFSVACGSSNKEANSPDEFGAEGEMQASADFDANGSGANTGARANTAGNQMDQNSTQVTVDRSVMEQCGLDEAKLYFPYDSANPKGNGDERVRSMADCLTNGNLRDKELQLVGHADPRGTEEYNEELGRSRAESVADLLISAGVPKEKLIVRSEGESQASDDQDQWPYDRRVEVSVITRE